MSMEHKRRFSICLLVCMVMLSTIAVSAAPVPMSTETEDYITEDHITIFAIADTWVQGGTKSNENYGNSEKMKVKSTSTENRDAFVKFEIPEISNIQTVTFSVYVVSMETATIDKYGGEYNIEVRAMQDTDWEEYGLTYDNVPDDTHDEVLGTITVAQENIGQYVSFDVTDYVKSHIGETISFRIRGVDKSRGADYAAREHPSGHAPKLDIVLGKSDTDPELDIREQRALEDTYTKTNEGPFGEATRMNVKSNSSLTDVRRAYLKFEIPDDVEGLLNKAEVKLFVDALEGKTPADGYDVTLFGINDDTWDEMTLTHETRPDDEGTPLDTVRVNSDTVGSYIRFDVTEFVRQHPDQIVSFYLQSTLGVSRGAYYRTKEHPENTPPVLILTYQEFAKPAVPEHLTGKGENKRVILSWEKTEYATAYEVERSENPSGPFEKMAEVTDTSYVDTNVVNGIQYYYRIRGINPLYEGEYSEVIEVMPRYPLEVAVDMTDIDGSPIENLNQSRYVHSMLKIENRTENTYDVEIKVQLQKTIRGKDLEPEIAMSSILRKMINEKDTSIVEVGYSLPELEDQEHYVLQISIMDTAENKELSRTLIFPNH